MEGLQDGEMFMTTEGPLGWGRGYKKRQTDGRQTRVKRDSKDTEGWRQMMDRPEERKTQGQREM